MCIPELLLLPPSESSVSASPIRLLGPHPRHHRHRYSNIVTIASRPRRRPSPCTEDEYRHGYKAGRQAAEIKKEPPPAPAPAPPSPPPARTPPPPQIPIVEVRHHHHRRRRSPSLSSISTRSIRAVRRRLSVLWFRVNSLEDRGEREDRWARAQREREREREREVEREREERERERVEREVERVGMRERREREREERVERRIEGRLVGRGGVWDARVGFGEGREREVDSWGGGGRGRFWEGRV